MSDIFAIQREYLKNKTVFVRTSYFEKLQNLVNSESITVLEWQRRVWKSSLLVSFIKESSIPIDSVFYLNKELDLLDTIQQVGDLEAYFIQYQQTFQDPKYIIIDEVQDIVWWEKFVRKYQSLGKYKIIITGSNSKLLSSELSTYLTGRYMSMEVFSFSYKEFLQFHQLPHNDENFAYYVEYGGMPELLNIENLETKKDYLKNVVSNILLKDIVSRYNIRDIKLLEKMLAYLANSIWSLVSINNISNYLQNQFKKEYSSKTIANYISYLEIPYLVNEVPRYDIRWKKILEYVWKYYFTDIWIANTFGFQFAFDIWKILENLVYLKLKQDGYRIYVWRQNEYEIDFVAEKHWEKMYIQVCYLLWNEQTLQREFWNLLRIDDNYKKMVLSLDKTFWNTYQWIENKNMVDWLLE